MVDNMNDPRIEAIMATLQTEYPRELQRYHQLTPAEAAFELHEDHADTDSIVVWRVENNVKSGKRRTLWHKGTAPKTALAVLQEIRRFSWFVEPPVEVAPELDRSTPAAPPAPAETGKVAGDVDASVGAGAVKPAPKE